MPHPAPNFTARILSTKRLRNSHDGNPRWAITFDNGATHNTQDNASVGYDIENLMHTRLGARYGVHVYLTARGTIWDLTRVEYPG